MRIPLLALAVAFALLSFPASALVPFPSEGANHSGSGLRITTSAATPAPLGLQIFCLRQPAHCAAAPATRLQMNPALLALLDTVNRSVNASIRPRMRPTQIWELGARAGDCKDYAMNKRAELIARGVPAGSLRLAIGLTAQGQGHAVLVVRTEEADYVLDNLTDIIKPVSETGHTLTAIASNDPTRWNIVR